MNTPEYREAAAIMAEYDEVMERRDFLMEEATRIGLDLNSRTVMLWQPLAIALGNPPLYLVGNEK
ncbi:MAG TPA: hypothetical protein VF463_07750 [Sphingobium sp.]